MRIAPALVGQRHHCIDIDQAVHALRVARAQRRGGAGDHHAAVAVAHQRQVMQLLGLDQAEHVVDVRLQRDVGPAQVRALAVASERDGVHLVAGGTQRRQHAAPDPGAVHENEGRSGAVHAVILPHGRELS
jgi:hypothetical protein